MGGSHLNWLFVIFHIYIYLYFLGCNMILDVIFFTMKAFHLKLILWYSGYNNYYNDIHWHSIFIKTIIFCTWFVFYMVYIKVTFISMSYYISSVTLYYLSGRLFSKWKIISISEIISTILFRYTHKNHSSFLNYYVSFVMYGIVIIAKFLCKQDLDTSELG